MSQEKVEHFLTEITQKDELRKQFQDVKNPTQFMEVCQKLGYDFTHEQLITVIKEHSKGVILRRKTGVWVWLRKVNWI